MVDPTLPLPGLSSVAGKPVIGRFDGGRLSSGGGLLVPREVERRLRVAERLAACIEYPRDPTRTVHTLADIIGFRLLAIAAGYEDGNDADSLCSDPLFKMALERRPSERDLCSQATISRLENLPVNRAGIVSGHSAGAGGDRGQQVRNRRRAGPCLHPLRRPHRARNRAVPAREGVRRGVPRDGQFRALHHPAHILPNCVAPLTVLATSMFGWVLLGIFPGLCISLTLLGINLLGDALRDKLDPRMRGV